MNLDDDLRRMFHDVEDRLDVPVRDDATETIVAGARRLRRRRAVVATASGALAVAVLAGVGILLATPEPESAPPAITSTTSTSSEASRASRSSSPPTSRSSSSRTSPAGTVPGDGGPAGGTGGGEEPDDETPAPPLQPPVTGSQIGPDGFGSVRLGMSYDELVATGAIQAGEPPAPSGCTAYEFANESGSGYVHLTAAGGAQAILTSTPTHTVEGVSNEWRLVHVRQFYPEVTREVIATQNPVPVEVRGNPSVVYMIAFVGDETVGFAVNEITLRYADQPCV